MPTVPPPSLSLTALYRAYIACLNQQDWAELGRYVDDDVQHNGRTLGLSGYCDMLVGDFRTIPDLRFDIAMLVCEPPNVAVRLTFDCTPRDEFLGLRIDGRRISFAENVIYTFRDQKISSVWSIIDKAAIEAQLRS